MFAQKIYYHLTEQEFERIGTTVESNAQILAELEKVDLILRPIGLKTYTEKSKQYLLSLPVEKKIEALAKLIDYATFVSNITEKNIDLDNDKSCLQYLMKTYGFKISDDFMNTVQTGDAVEILDLQGIQIYRNYSLLMLTDYDVLSLCAYEWTDLYARDPKITKELFACSARPFTENVPLFKFQIIDHLMVEHLSNEKVQFKQSFQFGASLLSENGDVIGLLLSIRAERLGTQESTGIGLLRNH